MLECCQVLDELECDECLKNMMRMLEASVGGI